MGGGVSRGAAGESLQYGAVGEEAARRGVPTRKGRHFGRSKEEEKVETALEHPALELRLTRRSTRKARRRSSPSRQSSKKSLCGARVPASSC